MQKIDYSTFKMPSDFMRFPEGSTVIRILTPGVFLKFHSIKTSRYIPLGECTGVGCEHCAKNSTPTDIFRWLVFDRSTKEVKVLNASKSLAKMLVELAQKEGDPVGYDIEVKRTGLGRNDTKYIVSKLPDKPMTEEEKSIISTKKTYFINKYFKS